MALDPLQEVDLVNFYNSFGVLYGDKLAIDNMDNLNNFLLLQRSDLYIIQSKLTEKQGFW